MSNEKMLTKKALIAVIFITVVLTAAVTSVAVMQLNLGQAPAGRVDKVIFSMDWLIFGKHAVFYTALDKGYYEENDISCTIVRGYGSRDTAKRVDVGTADFGFADMTAMLVLIGEGAQLKTVGMITHLGSDGLITTVESGITEPKDLEGKTIGSTAGDSGTPKLPYFFEVNGVDEDQVDIITVASDVKASMVASGQVDASTTTRGALGEATAIEEAGNTPYWLWFSDWGCQLYTHGIITTQKMIEEKPDLVRRFVNATYAGLDYAIRHKEEAIDILLKYHPDLDKDMSTRELEVFLETIGHPMIDKTGTAIGVMDPETVEFTLTVAIDTLSLPEISADDIYTNEFVE